MPKTTEQNRIVCTSKLEAEVSGVARNLIWGVYVLTSHCNFKTFGNVPHVNKTVTDFGGIYTDIPPVATPLAEVTNNKKNCVRLEVLCYCAIVIDATKLTADRHEASCGLFATAELLVLYAVINL